MPCNHYNIRNMYLLYVFIMRYSKILFNKKKVFTFLEMYLICLQIIIYLLSIL